MLSAILLSYLFTNAQASSSSSSPGISTKRNFTHCKALNTLGAELCWNLIPSPPNSSHNMRMELRFRAPLEDNTGWIAWGVNPTRSEPHMVGTRALIGVVLSNKSLSIDTYNITADTKKGCELWPSRIEPEVRDARMEYAKGLFSISATLGLPASTEEEQQKEGGGYNVSRLNHVWQVGYVIVEGTARPGMHPTTLQNVDSTEALDLWTGQSSHGVGRHRHHLRAVS